MKKIIAMLACMTMAFAAVSCGDSSDDEKEDKKSSSSVESAESKEDGVQDANGAASDIYKAANSAIVEMDMEGVNISDGVYHHEAGESTITSDTDLDGEKFYKKMEAYINGLKDISFTVQISKYVCSAAAAEYNGYYGTMSTVITKSNIDEYNFNSLEDAFNAVAE